MNDTEWEPWGNVRKFTGSTPEEYAANISEHQTSQLKTLRDSYELGFSGRRTTMPTYGLIIAELAKRELLK